MSLSLPSQGNRLSIEKNSRQNGDIEEVTCEGVVGEFTCLFTVQNAQC